jgi:hypothetical protein
VASTPTDDVLVRTIRSAERALTFAGAAMSDLLEALQLRMRAFEVTRDPQVQRWAAEMRALVERGEIDRLLAEQPDDPQVLIEQRRAAAS